MKTVEAEVKKENKFVVVKIKDIDKYLSTEDKASLRDILGSISDSRLREKKGVNKYVVCNQDEPYADQVWETILQGEREKRK